MERVRAQSFRDLEEPSHRVLYSEAVSLLSEGKFGPAVSRLEESLSLALSALEECRTLCEGTRESENETHRDLSEVIAEYYVQVLQCKQRCVLEDSVRPGQKRAEEDIIESRLSLLQDGYARRESPPPGQEPPLAAMRLPVLPDTALPGVTRFPLLPPSCRQRSETGKPLLRSPGASCSSIRRTRPCERGCRSTRGNCRTGANRGRASSRTCAERSQRRDCFITPWRILASHFTIV
ncbi:hypothetical protein FKM82_026671 [Ascaphus truei]